MEAPIDKGLTGARAPPLGGWRVGGLLSSLPREAQPWPRLGSAVALLAQSLCFPGGHWGPHGSSSTSPGRGVLEPRYSPAPGAPLPTL